MPYVEERCVAGKTVEVCRYYSKRYHPRGEVRRERENETTEAQDKVNTRQAIKKLRRLLNANFTDDDYLIRFDFYKVKPETSEEMQKLTAKAIRKIKTKAEKAGTEIKYVYVKEVGPKGSRHIHMVINRIDIQIITSCWDYGGIHIDPLQTDEYSKIAEYFIKYAKRTEATEQIVGKKWYGSRNLTKPRISKKIISANKFRKCIREQEGYRIKKESVHYGITDDGFEYMSFMLIKTTKKENAP